MELRIRGRSIHDWSFPVIILVAWLAAATYTVIAVGRLSTAGQERTITEASTRPIAVVNHPAPMHPGPG